MYTLEELKQKNLKELKEIGWQLNVLPDGDRRCRRNWIKALVGVQPTLLQLLEVSPGVETVQELIEVQAIGQIEIQAIEPIAPAAETSPSVPEGDRPLVLTKDAAETFLGVSRKTSTARQLLELFKSSAVILEDSLAAETEAETLESAIGLAAKNLFDAEGDRSLPLVDYAAQNSPVVAEGDRSLPLVEYAAQTSPAEVELVAEAIGEVQEPLPEISPAEVELFAQAIEVQVQELIEVQAIEPIKIQAIEPIAPAAETSPSVPEGDRPLVLTKDAAETFPGVSRKTLTARQLLEQFKSSAVILGDSPAAETEAETLESAIGLAAKNLLDAEADQNPILTNITFSPGFLAHYSPPRSENIHYQTDADGQLSLLDFEVESVDEPPDPDDFESLNAFREAVSLWDNIPNRWKFPSTLSASGHRVQTTGTSRHHPKCWNSHRRSSPRAALTKVPAFANS